MADGQTWACCAYLRKSREDEERERRRNEDTLAKHRRIIEDLAADDSREIAEWYQEVVSGETIAGRPEMVRLLADVAAGKWDAVYVVEASRLGRGGGSDQEKIVNAIRYTGTFLISEYKTYDPSSEADMRLLKNELRNSEDELASITTRLMRGKKRAAGEGIWLATARPPYGWEAVRIDGCWQLVPSEHHAHMLRIYDMLEAGDGLVRIAKTFNAEGVPTSRGGKHWTASAVRAIALNKANCGYVSYGKVKTVRVFDPDTFEVHKEHKRMAEGAYQSRPGLHYGKGGIDEQRWERITGNILQNARVHGTKELRNPLSSILVCGKCGYSMTLRSNHGNYYYQHKAERLMTRPCDGCHSAKYEVVLDAVVGALLAQCAEIEAYVEGNADRAAYEAHVAALDDSIARLGQSRQRVMDAYEAGAYSVQELKARLADVDSKLAALEAERDGALPPAFTPDTVASVRRCIEVLRTDGLSPKDKNDFLKRVIERIDYFNDTPRGCHTKDNLKLEIYLR